MPSAGSRTSLSFGGILYLCYCVYFGIFFPWQQPTSIYPTDKAKRPPGSYHVIGHTTQVPDPPRIGLKYVWSDTVVSMLVWRSRLTLSEYSLLESPFFSRKKCI